MSVKISLACNLKGEFHLWQNCLNDNYYLELEYTCVQLDRFEALELALLMKSSPLTQCNEQSIDALVRECEDYRSGKHD